MLLQLEQLEGFVTVHEYATGTEVVPQVGKMELLESAPDAGEHRMLEYGPMTLVGGLITQMVWVATSKPHRFFTRSSIVYTPGIRN